MASSPTVRTLALLRDEGYIAAVTEKWNPFAKIRQDLFGFVDVLAIGNNSTLAVQCTSRSNISARVKKITEQCEDALHECRRAGWRIEVWGWDKDSKKKWRVKRVDLS